MPSKLPIIKANTSQENILKMKVIANANKRSVAKELEWIIDKHIAEYEKEHGVIDTLIKISTDKNLSFTEKAKASFKTGYNITNPPKQDTE